MTRRFLLSALSYGHLQSRVEGASRYLTVFGVSFSVSQLFQSGDYWNARFTVTCDRSKMKNVRTIMSSFA